MKTKIQYCNFCGKSSKEIKKMIGSTIDNCLICEDCIKYCMQILLVKDIKKILNDSISKNISKFVTENIQINIDTL